jgi:hypothetical protein
MKLKGHGQALADPLQQADPVAGALAATPRRFPCHQDDAGNLALRVPSRHRVRPHEDSGPVDALAGERPFPRPAAQHVLGHVLNRGGV